MSDVKKPILFTGITPTGTLTLGHYFGVIQHLIKLQDEYEIFLMIADLHAITTINNKKVDYCEKTKELASLIYSCGLKEENCKIFVQSQINGHLELAYFLSSYCSLGRIKNMIQFKEKSKENDSNFSLLSYPILMASDILLYNADLVIVGKDQKQHLELTQYLANKFNEKNNKCLKTPRFKIPSVGSKIMGLRDPSKKMSKSTNDYIAILDNSEVLRKKIMKAETDSESKIYFDAKKKPGISNLLTIYSCLNGLSIEESEDLLKDSSYNDFKLKILNDLNVVLNKVKIKFNSYYQKIDKILKSCNSRISNIAKGNLKNIKKELKLWDS